MRLGEGVVLAAAAKWAAQRALDVTALAARDRLELVSDVGQEVGVPPGHVADVLIALWSRANHDAGAGLRKFIGPSPESATYAFSQLIPKSTTVDVRANAAKTAPLATWKATTPTETNPQATELSARAFSMDNAGNAKGALEVYAEALKQNPLDARIRTRIGLALKHIGEIELAKQFLDAALALDMRFAPAHYNLACIAALETNEAAAEFHLRKAIAIDANQFTELATKDADFANLGGGAAFLKRIAP